MDNLSFNLMGEYIHIRFLGDDNIVFDNKTNILNENTGLTVENPQPNIPVYYISLSDFGDNLLCGNIVDNIYGALIDNDLNNIILVIDFDGIKRINESFCEEYVKYLLTSKNKILTVNQNIEVSNAFSDYVLSNIEILELRE